MCRRRPRGGRRPVRRSTAASAVAACPNGSPMLFVAAKVSRLAHLPQGQPERHSRALAMIGQADAELFANCTDHYECGEACPKEIPVRVIAEMNRDYLRAALAMEEPKAVAGSAWETLGSWASRPAERAALTEFGPRPASEGCAPPSRATIAREHERRWGPGHRRGPFCDHHDDRHSRKHGVSQQQGQPPPRQ